MWRLVERDGDDLRHVADYRSEDHAKELLRSLQQVTDRHFVVYPTEGRFETTLEWRVWPMSPRTGYPDTSGGPLLASVTRAFAEAYIRDRRPIGEDWRLFRLESNGDQQGYGLSDGEPVLPHTIREQPRAIYHAVEIERGGLDMSLRSTSNFNIVASFADQQAAQAYIDARPDQFLHLMSTIGLAADALLKPVPPAVVPVPVSSGPRPRRRALRI
jgi:hypothetical protein